MTMPGEIEAAATGAFWTAKRVAIALGVLLAIVALCIVAYFVFVAPGRAANELAAAKGTAAMGRAGTQSGQQAVQIVNKHDQEGANTDAQTARNQVIILKQPGAAVLLDPALDDAGRRAVCMRKSAAELAGCVGLHEPGPP